MIEALSKDFSDHYHDLIGSRLSGKKPGGVSLGFQNQILDKRLNRRGLKKPSIIGHDFDEANR